MAKYNLKQSRYCKQFFDIVYFLWRHLKEKVYANHPVPIGKLQDNIRADLTEVSITLCENVMQNAIKSVLHAYFVIIYHDSINK